MRAIKRRMAQKGGGTKQRGGGFWTLSPASQKAFNRRKHATGLFGW